MKTARIMAIGFLLAAAAMGCGEPQSTAPPPQSTPPPPQSTAPSASGATRDSVRITSILPAPEQPLRVGATARFEVQVEYNLASNASGSVTLVIQQGESGHMPLANETAVIQKGKGTVTLRKELVIPETAAIVVFTPLNVQGGASTSVVDSRTYSVIKG